MSDQTVTIEKFDEIGKDSRGETSSFSLPRSQKDFIFLTRKSNSLSGNTYHEGKNSGTSPKTFLLLSGEIKFSYRSIKEQGFAESEFVRAPAIIKISPFVTHKIETLCDVIMIECNSVDDIKDDRVREDV